MTREQEIAAAERELEAELCRRSFDYFKRRFWHVAEPHRPYMPTLSSQAIGVHLQALADNKLSKPRLAISIKPASGKSTELTLFGAWLWARNPGARSIFASHAHSLAVRDSQRCRRIVEHDDFRRLFPQVVLRSDANRADHYETTAGGHRYSVGVGGALTGLRAGAGGVIGIDDSLNQVDARSKAARDSVIEWFDVAVSTRLDPGQGGIVIVQQRQHRRDLIGHALDLGFESLVLAAEYTSSRRCVTSVWQDPRTEEGELLDPELCSREYLDEQKRILGSTQYACQYGCSPGDEDGNLFEKRWWRWWRPDGTAAPLVKRPEGCTDIAAVPLPKEGRIVISLDAAFKDLTTSDAVCFLVARVVGAEMYLLARRYGKMSFTATCDTLTDLARQYRGATVLVEDKANGSAILDTLRKLVPNLVAVTPKESKEARAAACSPAVEAGQAFLPDGAEWVQDQTNGTGFVQECAAFPLGLHDDQVDAFSQLANWVAVNALDDPLENMKAATSELERFFSGVSVLQAGGNGEDIAEFEADRARRRERLDRLAARHLAGEQLTKREMAAVRMFRGHLLPPRKPA